MVWQGTPHSQHPSCQPLGRNSLFSLPGLQVEDHRGGEGVGMLTRSTGTRPELLRDFLQLPRNVGATRPTRQSPGGRMSIRDSAFPCILLPTPKQHSEQGTGCHDLWSHPMHGMGVFWLSRGCVALGSRHVVDETPGCQHVPRDAEPHCHQCPGAPTPPLPAAAPALPSPLHPLPGTKWHVWAWGHWEPVGDAVVQDPNKTLIQDQKTSIAGAVPAWKQVRGPANPSQ